MIAVDSNILVYAHRQESPFHEIARSKLSELAEGGRLWAIPWPCIHEFFSVVTHSRIFGIPTPLDLALAQVETWLAGPRVQTIGETPGYWSILKNILQQGKISGPKVHDARVVAICVQNGVTVLWSADRDFSRMSGIEVVNPLVGT